MPIIREWEWNDGNLAELADHGLTPARVRQVASEDPRFRRNRKGRTASHQMIGPDHGQTLWVVCIVRLPGTDDVWRAITGWKAEGREIDWYERSR
jgi:hypothetical protein